MEWDERGAKILGDHVRLLRRSRGISQEDLARKVGVSKNQTQLIAAGRQSGRETGRPSNPRTSTLWGLASALGLPTSQLLALVEESLSEHAGDEVGTASRPAAQSTQ